MKTFEQYSPCIYNGTVKCSECPQEKGADGCDMFQGRELRKKAFEAGSKESAEEQLLRVIQNKPQTGEMVRLKQVIQAIDQEPEYPGDMPEAMKQAFGGNTDLIIKALKYTVSLTKKSIRKRVDALNAVEPFKIEVYQHDWTPGFAAFNDDGSIQQGATAHISLDLGSFLATIAGTNDLHPKELPYVIAETIMHEVIHSLEAWAGQEFNEEKVEALLQKYREKYKNSPINE